MLKLYNTLTRQKEAFKPIHRNRVGLYTCGPTVYNYAHIGNLRTYIFEDILQRTLEYEGYAVNRVMNITDVGHLTADSDTGEDKVEKEAKKERKSVMEIVHFYTKAFFDDLRELNIKIPEILEPATKHIDEEQKIIKKLFENGLAYETESAVYFDVAKYGLEKYLKLSRQPLDEKRTGAREEVIVDPQKKSPADFVLWFKLAGKFKNHIQHWPSPWGEGFPGWHIECSAISSKFLGQPFDIHVGGVDHIGTHHTNEIAQSEGAYGVPLANFWLHGEFLLMSDAKMAKSVGNFLTLGELEKRGINPLAFRYFVLNTHYRSKLNFSWKGLEGAQAGLKNLYRSVYHLLLEKNRPAPNAKKVTRRPDYDAQFSDALNDDLNAPRALSWLHEAVRAENFTAKEKLALIEKFDRVLGLKLLETAKGVLKANRGAETANIRKLVGNYEKFRASKQFMNSDRLRKKILELGYEVEDTKSGTILWPKHPL